MLTFQGIGKGWIHFLQADISQIKQGVHNTFHDPTDALTWWNSHVKTVSHEVAYEMTWKTLKKIMPDKYCPRGEIKKLEIELMFPEESDEVEKYVGGLPDVI
ncbi:hypothetical protein Tco_0504549 [Tanacetum coccineum]